MNIQKILKRISIENGVSVAEVKYGIQEALDCGWNSTDEEVRSYWRKIPTQHDKPTIEEVVLYIINSIK